MHKQVDITIVGGGLTGATFMLALQGLGWSTLLIEAQPFTAKINPDFDARSLALSPASQRILNELGIWNKLEPFVTPIHLIHISEQHQFGMSRLQSSPANPLGYVVEVQYINQILHQLLPCEQLLSPAKVTALDLATKTLTVSTATGDCFIQSQLIVAADGASSAMRHLCRLPAQIKCYNQQAIVTNVGLIKNHNNKAFERFTSEGPLALLPMKDQRMSLVWAMKPQKAQDFLQLSERSFLKELQNAFGYRLGPLIKIGKRQSYPLKQVLMTQKSVDSVVFLGNAAHTLHPVAGQGFNLGLRDAATLAQCINQYGLNKSMLTHYLQLRARDQKIITQLTNGLVELFTSNLPGVSLARNLGLLAFDNIPFLKHYLMRYTQGFGGVIPDLVCQRALTLKEHRPEIS